MGLAERAGEAAARGAFGLFNVRRGSRLRRPREDLQDVDQLASATRVFMAILASKNRSSGARFQ